MRVYLQFTMFAKKTGSSMRRKIVAGNWKMNLQPEEVNSLTSEIINMVKSEVLSDTLVVIAPPFIYLNRVNKLLPEKDKKILLAAQNCASSPSGAFTGEVSAGMIKSSGASFVIIGHSERRKFFNESNEELAKKVSLVFENNMEPIFCCGETLEERNNGQHFKIITRQIEEGLFHISGDTASRIVIAYEPVWAIGTGNTASPAQAQEMHLFIRNLLEKKYGRLASQISLLYGGSCNEQNAAELFSLPDIDGGLIGGASLKSRSFVNIIKCMH